MENQPIIKEVLVNAPANEVWSAITEKEKIKKWSFDIEEFRPVPGNEFRFWGGTEKKKFLHICVIKEAIENEKLSYTWRYDGIPGNTLVTFDITSEGDKSRIKLTHEGLDTFPKDMPELARENFDQGWEEIIKSLLKDFLENKK